MDVQAPTCLAPQFDGRRIVDVKADYPLARGIHQQLHAVNAGAYRDVRRIDLVDIATLK